MPGVVITAPATTANFGPGFDCVGIALELSNTVTANWSSTQPFSGSETDLVAVLAQNTTVSYSGRYTQELQSLGIDLFFTAMARLLAPVELIPEHLTLDLNVEIPLARGLGSSAACIVSGLCLAREIAASAQRKIDFAAVAKEAVRLEGHPDNVLPCLYGGACLNLVQPDQAPWTFQFTVPEELSFVVAIPDIRVSTANARKVLPQTVSLGEAVQNSAHLGGLLLALHTKDFTKLPTLIKSSLHVPYRAALIPGYQEVEAAAYRAGASAVTISGSGPSVLALVLYSPEEVGEQMVRAFKKHSGITAEYIVSKVAPSGTKVDRN